MTPIQARSLPPILAGRDVIGQGKTGSGKTAAFGLGLLQKLDVKRFAIQALVLCPTRELADQVAKEIRRLGRGIHNIKVLTPVDLTHHMLDRINAVDSRLKCFIAITKDRALKEAEEAEREIAAGNYRGPLHGIPIAIKDLIDTKGVPTLGGLAVLKGNVPDQDAPVLKKLNAAGAIMIGKLNLTEGAMAGYHRDFDIPVNPWNADYWPGASSSGPGVAAAAGLCFAAIGTDTAGSIRFPAMANGVVGLKPTFGLVGKSKVFALGDSLDHVGPLTRRVADAAIVLEAMAGHVPSDPNSLDRPVPDLTSGLDMGVKGMRIGYDAAAFLAGFDALALPPGIGPLRNDYDLYQDAATLQPLFDAAHLEYTVPFNLSGAPSLTLPCGFNGDGMPLTIQFGGAPFTEAKLCQIGHAYEQATSWHQRNPPISIWGVIWCQQKIIGISACALLRPGKMPQWFEGRGLANLLTCES